MGGLRRKKADTEGSMALFCASNAGHEEVVAFLLSQGAQASCRDGIGKTPLMWACEEDHLGVVRVLVQHMGTEGLKDTDYEGRTALHCAAYWGRQEAVALLLNKGAQANSSDRARKTPFMMACEAGHVGVARVLLPYIGDGGLKDTDEQERSALHMAALGGHKDTVAFLLSKGAQADRRDAMGKTPLEWACDKGHVDVVWVLAHHMAAQGHEGPDAQGGAALLWAVRAGHEKVVALLLGAGAPANSKGESGMTPLMVACEEGHMGVVRVLLRHTGTEGLQVRDDKGWTALHYAAAAGRAEVSTCLLTKGALANLRDGEGRTPLILASWKGHLGVVRVLADRMAGQELEQTDNKGWTALHWAAEGCHEEVMAFLLSEGAQASNRPGADTTILMWACAKGYVVVARALLKCIGVTALQETDAHGLTPLHCSACWGHEELVGLLLEQGAQANSRDVLCRTPLMLACEKGQVDVVRLLLQHTRGQGLHDVDKQGMTALELAALGGHDETVAFLVLDKTVEAHSKDTRGRTPLMVACSKRRVVVVRAVVKHLGVEVLQETDEKGWTALHWAVDGGNEKTVSLLLGRGADASSKSSAGSTPFMIACRKGRLGVARLLLEHTGEEGLRARNNKRWTPLHYAACGGHKEVVVFLLEKGAEPNSRDNGGKVPLLWACMHGHMGAVRVFIQHMGVQGLQVSDRRGMTALHEAAEGGHEEVVAFLLNEGAQANSRAVGGLMPLLSACEKGHLGAVKLLAQHMGIQGVEERSERGWTALHSASRGGHKEVVAFLISTGARTNSRDDYGMMPLDWACENGHVGVVRVLLKHMGAHVLSETHGGGTTALHWAVGKGHDVIVRLLLLAGADPRMTDYEGKTPRALAEKGEGRAGCVAVFEVSERTFVCIYYI
jgi:ankyrin repeat protein